MLAIVAPFLAAALVAGPPSPSMTAQTASGAVSTVNLRPVADTYTTSRLPRVNRGKVFWLRISSRPHNTDVVYLRFAVPRRDVPLVTRARLVLHRTPHHLSGAVGAWTIRPKSWFEPTTDARNAPARLNRIDRVPLTAASDQAVLDVTDAVKGRTTVNLAVTSSLTRGFVQFYSREANARRPVMRLSLASPRRPKPSPTGGASSTGSGGGAGTGLPRPSCSISATLVPACGRWWGIDPLAYTSTPVRVGLPVEEQLANRPMDIVHVYHRNGQLFPTAAERSLALDPVNPRLLLINWKPATNMTWAAVAAGNVDPRIDQLATYITDNFPYRFFLTIWHEPENDVVATPGSGMTAADYASMYRHVVLRLRSDGVTKAITVMDYMGFDNWAKQPWFNQLWPGNDVVDWVGIDPYGTGAASGWSARDFQTLVNRPSGGFPGFYSWSTQTHPDKPMMLAEWGVHYDPTNPTGQATFFNSVANQIGAFPDIKALVYFDAPHLPNGEAPTSITNSVAVKAWQKLGRDTLIVAPRVSS